MAYTSADTMLDYLLSSGLTKTDLCKMSGINRRTLYKYLRRRDNGGRPLLPATVKKLEKAYAERVRQLQEDAATRKELGL